MSDTSAPTGWLEDVPGGWDMVYNFPGRSRVRIVDNVLSKRLPPPPPPGNLLDPDYPLDLLGRVEGGPSQCLVVVDEWVMHEDNYGPAIEQFYAVNGLTPAFSPQPAGEEFKTLDSAVDIWAAFGDAEIPRHGPPVRAHAWGGGVTSDKFGLTGSTHRRGVPRAVYPTTLVGMVDAAPAAKSAVDFHGNKNRIGAYRPADLVVIDRRFLATLPRRRISDGLGEVVKIAIAVDGQLFRDLEKHGSIVLAEQFQGLHRASNRAALKILKRSVRGTLSELAPNLHEANSARALYLGHNWSPAVEMASVIASQSSDPAVRRPWLYHGEAVALDLVLSAGIALHRGLITADEYARIVALLDLLGLPIWDPLLADDDLLAAGMADTVLHRGGRRQMVPLPFGIGQVVFVDDITPAEVRRAVARMRALGGRSLA